MNSTQQSTFRAAAAREWRRRVVDITDEAMGRGASRDYIVDYLRLMAQSIESRTPISEALRVSDTSTKPNKGQEAP